MASSVGVHITRTPPPPISPQAWKKACAKRYNGNDFDYGYGWWQADQLLRDCQEAIAALKSPNKPKPAKAAWQNVRWFEQSDVRWFKI